MKKSTLRQIIKEAISDMEVSLKLSNGKIIHGKARTNPKALSLQIGSNTYFSFWEGKFSSGGVKIVEGVDDYSQEWFLKATEEYLEAMHETYPERFGPLKEDFNPDGRNPYNGFLSTDDTKIVIVRSNEDWEKLATSLGSKGFKHQGSLNPLNPNKGLTQMSNYAKFPYEVIINKTQKLVDFGEHTLNENKMTKKDIIRIINEEVETALDEMYDPIYDSMMPEILAMLAAGAAGVKMAINHLKSKGLDKQAIIDVIKKAKSKLNELKATNKGKDITKHLNDYLEGKINKSEFEKLTGLKKESVNETTKHTIVVYNGKRLAVEPGDIERLKSGKDVVGNSTKYAGQEEWIQAKGKWKIEESINENESDGYYHAIVNIFLENGLELQEDIPFGYTGVNLEKFIKELRDILYVTVEEQNSKLVRVSINKKTKPDALKVIKKHSDRIGSVIKGFKETQHTLVESVDENEGMTKSLKDIDPSLSLTTYGTKPPSFKITYRVKDDMSKEMEEELVAWVLSKGGVVESVSNDFDVEDGERYYYPYVKFSYK
jgi:signal peptidase I